MLFDHDIKSLNQWQYSDADQTVFEGVVRFLQKWSGSSPFQGLVVRSVVRFAVQKYKSFYTLPENVTLFDNLL